MRFSCLEYNEKMKLSCCDGKREIIMNEKYFHTVYIKKREAKRKTVENIYIKSC